MGRRLSLGVPPYVVGQLIPSVTEPGGPLHPSCGTVGGVGRQSNTICSMDVGVGGSPDKHGPVVNITVSKVTEVSPRTFL